MHMCSHSSTDDHAARLELLHQQVGDLRGEPLLHLRPAGVDLDQPGQLGQPGDPPVRARDVADVRHALERQQVVLAEADITSMSRTSTSSSWSASNVVVSTCAGSTRRPANSSAYARATRAGVCTQAVAVGVLADRDQDLAHGLLDPAEVDGLLDRRAGRACRRPAGRRGSRARRRRPARSRTALSATPSELDVRRAPSAARRRRRGASAPSASACTLSASRSAGREHRRLGRRPALAEAVVRRHRRPLDDPGADPGHVGRRDGLLLDQLQHDVVEHVAVLDQDLPGLVVRQLDQRAHLAVDLGGDRRRSSPARGPSCGRGTARRRWCRT